MTHPQNAFATLSTVVGTPLNPRPQNTHRPPAPRPWLRRPGNRNSAYAPAVLPADRPAQPQEAKTESATARTGFRDYLYSVRADLHRKRGRSDARTFVRALFSDAAFKHTFWFRTASFVVQRRSLRYTLYPLVRTVYRNLQHKHGVWIPPPTRIGPGLFLEHLGDTFINSRAVIGKNCNIANGVTIGQSNRGARKGCPRIGDNVFIGPGAKIIGAVTIGDHVAIGANCVVVKDVPENAVIAAQPGQVISYRGSSGYVNNTDYA